jgi:hypothetical protein
MTNQLRENEYADLAAVLMDEISDLEAEIRKLTTERNEFKDLYEDAKATREHRRESLALLIRETLWTRGYWAPDKHCNACDLSNALALALDGKKEKEQTDTQNENLEEYITDSNQPLKKLEELKKRLDQLEKRLKDLDVI